MMVTTPSSQWGDAYLTTWDGDGFDTYLVWEKGNMVCQRDLRLPRPSFENGASPISSSTFLTLRTVSWLDSFTVHRFMVRMTTSHKIMDGDRCLPCSLLSRITWFLGKNLLDVCVLMRLVSGRDSTFATRMRISMSRPLSAFSKRNWDMMIPMPGSR